MKAEVMSTAFPPEPGGAEALGGARRRRPGPRRSTSTRTAYVGAVLAAADDAELPPMPARRGLGRVAVVLFPDGRRQATSRFPSRRYSSSERTDLRSPWAARFDEQRGRPQRLGDSDSPCPSGAWAVRGCSTSSASSSALALTTGAPA